MAKTARTEYWEILNCLHEHNINPITREIYLGGFPPSYEDEEIGVDHQMACELIRNITFLESQSDDPILVHMCTVGGDDSYGMAIYNAIHECSCYVTIRAYAHARSMSSVILQAGDHRQLMPDCYFMIHHGTVFATDTYKGAKSYLKLCDDSARRMMQVYTSRCDLTAKAIEAELDKKQEWYLTATEAVELGFADEVYRLS